jgi:hypothetical protein
MLMTVRPTLAAAALLLAGCDQSAAPPARNNAAAARSAPDPSPSADQAAAGAPRIEQGALVYTLAGNGLEPRLAFGMPQREVVAAATAVFGPPTATEHNEECGEGPMDFVNFGGLSLGFQQGRFAGWSLSEGHPSLRTAGGLAIGAPRSALGDAEIDRDSTLGPEFSIGDVGGLLDPREREVIALWAGLPCQFR